MADVAIRFSPPWLPLWGSCHEVTERVNIALSAFGTSPIGEGFGTHCLPVVPAVFPLALF